MRALYRRLLLRPGLLGALAAVPAGALLWLIGRSPERAVGAVIADPLVQSLFAAFPVDGSDSLCHLRAVRSLILAAASVFPAIRFSRNRRNLRIRDQPVLHEENGQCHTPRGCPPRPGTMGA